MQIKNLFLLLLVATLLTSCSSPSHETKFSREGISFTCPEGWKITDAEDINGQGYNLSCEKDGWDASGLVTIVWVNGTLELDEFLNIHKKEFENNTILKYSNMHFENAVDTMFNSIDARAMPYTLSLAGVKHQGIIFCFYGNAKTIGVVKQGTLEDKTANKAGFTAIENSFTCN